MSAAPCFQADGGCRRLCGRRLTHFARGVAGSERRVRQVPYRTCVENRQRCKARREHPSRIRPCIPPWCLPRQSHRHPCQAACQQCSHQTCTASLPFRPSQTTYEHPAPALAPEPNRVRSSLPCPLSLLLTPRVTTPSPAKGRLPKNWTAPPAVDSPPLPPPLFCCFLPVLWR